MNATAVLCERHGRATGAGTQRRQRIQQFVTSPRDNTDITDQGKQQCFIFSVHFLCFRLPLFSSLLLTFLFPSSLHHLLSSPTRFYSFVLSLSTGRKETNMEIKLQIRVFVLKQLLTLLLFHPEE